MKSLRLLFIPLAGLAMMAVLSGCGNTAAPTGPVSTLDTTPPPVPSSLSFTRDAMGQAVLSWSPSTAPDLASYEVSMYSPSPDRDNSYIIVSDPTPSNNAYALPWASKLTQGVYRVRAVDTAGNKSAFSAAITVLNGASDPPPFGRDDLPARAKPAKNGN